jgi:TRAP-type C4-dicarboxylate transport system substrate-binding protein
MTGRSLRLAISFAITLFGARANAETVIRFATVAPEGSAWAREMRAAGREIAAATQGRVVVKWYFGGIAGDDVQAGARAERGQLDGIASGGMLCQKLAPSLRVLRIPGLLQTREQAAYVVTHMRSAIDDEFLAKGFTNLAEIVLGASIVFSRKPVADMATLRASRLWKWDLDEISNQFDRAMGMKIVPLPLEAGVGAYDRGEIDGFYAVPEGALAFQWSAQTRYFTTLPMDFLVGCVILKTSVLDQLILADRQALVGAVAKLAVRAEDLDQRMGDALVGGLFEKQGLKRVALSESFTSEFFAAARDARDRLAGRLVPAETLKRVLGWLADQAVERTFRRR